MSPIDTNKSYLSTIGIDEDSPIVGEVVSVYYLGCVVGAVLASRFADAKGRRPGIFACLTTASLGNFLMFIAGFGKMGHIPSFVLATILAGRVVMGLGVGEEDISPFVAVALPATLERLDQQMGQVNQALTGYGAVSVELYLISSSFPPHNTQTQQERTRYIHKLTIPRLRLQVYGPRIFSLLGFDITSAGCLTLGN